MLTFLNFSLQLCGVFTNPVVKCIVHENTDKDLINSWYVCLCILDILRVMRSASSDVAVFRLGLPAHGLLLRGVPARL